jgi:purine-binding chemotaxis protein CheW
VSWCVIKSGDRLYGIEVDRVLEVLRNAAIEGVPVSPSGVAGLLNLRGQLVVALDVQQLAEGVSAGDRERVVAVVVSYGGESVALCVDSVIDVREISHEELAPIPSGSGVEDIGRMVTIDSERMVIGLDVDALIKRVGCVL